MEASKKSLDRIVTAAENLKHLIAGAADETMTESELAHYEATEEFIKKFDEAMDDDFNTQNGITVVYELARELNVYAAREEVNRATLEYLLQNFATLVEIFGIEFENEELGDEKIEALIKKRDEARANRDFATSDEIRDTLKDQGIILERYPTRDTMEERLKWQITNK